MNIMSAVKHAHNQAWKGANFWTDSGSSILLAE